MTTTTPASSRRSTLRLHTIRTQAKVFAENKTRSEAEDNVVRPCTILRLPLPGTRYQLDSDTQTPFNKGTPPERTNGRIGDTTPFLFTLGTNNTSHTLTAELKQIQTHE